MTAELNDRLLFDAGFIKMVERTASLDDQLITRTVVTHLGAVVVVPVTTSGHAILIRQFRLAANAWVTELPAGKRDVDGEPAKETARRELAEECGVAASKLIRLCHFLNSPGFTDESTEIFLALGLTSVPRSPQSPEEAAADVVSVRLDRVYELVASGALIDGKSIIGLTIARDFLATPNGVAAAKGVSDSLVEPPLALPR